MENKPHNLIVILLRYIVDLHRMYVVRCYQNIVMPKGNIFEALSCLISTHPSASFVAFVPL